MDELNERDEAEREQVIAAQREEQEQEGKRSIDYRVGSPEWHAYEHGYLHGLCWMTERDSPLDGQWAGSPLPREVIHEAWQKAGGPKDEALDELILDAWEEGYHNSFRDR